MMDLYHIGHRPVAGHYSDYRYSDWAFQRHRIRVRVRRTDGQTYSCQQHSLRCKPIVLKCSVEIVTQNSTDHIGHKPHRPHERTISTTRNNHSGHRKVYCNFELSFECSVNIQNLTSYAISSHINTSAIVGIFHSDLLRVVKSTVWVTIHSLCS